MTSLRDAAQQALNALDRVQPQIRGAIPQQDVEDAIDALRAALAEPVYCEPQQDAGDGWSHWVCPAPKGYLMQCCDCGLIHEIESRVAKYEPRPSEVFEVVDDPDLQMQFRMKRRDDISPQRKPLTEKKT